MSPDEVSAVRSGKRRISRLISSPVSGEEFQRQLVAGVTKEDFGEVVRVLVSRAKSGEEWAVKFLLDRLCGIGRGARDRLTIKKTIESSGDEDVRTVIEAMRTVGASSAGVISDAT